MYIKRTKSFLFQNIVIRQIQPPFILSELHYFVRIITLPITTSLRDREEYPITSIIA